MCVGMWERVGGEGEAKEGERRGEGEAKGRGRGEKGRRGGKGEGKRKLTSH